MTGFFEMHDPVPNGYVRNAQERPRMQPHTKVSTGYVLSTKGKLLGTFGDHPLKYVEYIPWESLELYVPDRQIDEVRDRKLVLRHCSKGFPRRAAFIY